MEHTLHHGELLRALAEEAAQYSYVPYSGRVQGVILLLSDGCYVRGCRVENASFQLTIGALDNAWSTVFAIGRRDICAVAASEPWSLADRAFLAAMPAFDWTFPSDYVALLTTEIPQPTSALLPLMESPVEGNVHGATLARNVASRAWVPESDFPVGSVVQTVSSLCIPGVNVEHPDWHRVLCAERNALSTLVAYGFDSAKDIFVSCLNEPGGTPCGACRQVIVELAPDATVWLDRVSQPPMDMQASVLLPGSFTGRGLHRYDL